MQNFELFEDTHVLFYPAADAPDADLYGDMEASTLSHCETKLSAACVAS